jgi:hypothetical protein
LRPIPGVPGPRQEFGLRRYKADQAALREFIFDLETIAREHHSRHMVLYRMGGLLNRLPVVMVVLLPMMILTIFLDMLEGIPEQHMIDRDVRSAVGDIQDESRKGQDLNQGTSLEGSKDAEHVCSAPAQPPC